MKTKLLVAALMLATTSTPALAGNDRNSPYWCTSQKGKLISLVLPLCYIGH